MANQRWAILVTESTWRIVASGGTTVNTYPVEPDGADPAATTPPNITSHGPVPTEQEGIAQRASLAAALLEKNGYSGQPLTLSIPSTWCMAAAISTEGLPRSGATRRQAMVFRLEEQLPVAAEDMVADFIQRRTTPGQQTLGVAVLTQRLLPLVNALEAHQVRVGTICPTALYCLQTLVDAPSPDQDPGQDQILVLSEPEYFDVLHCREGQLVAWHVASDISTDERGATPQHSDPTPNLTSDLLRLLRSHVLHCRSQPLLTLFGGDTTLAERISADLGLPVKHDEGWSTDNAVAAAVKRMDTSNDHSAMVVNLRRDALDSGDALRHIRTPLKALVSTSLLLGLVLIAAMGWRSYRYDQHARNQIEHQQQIFLTLYPGQGVPINVRIHLESELRRLRGISGGGGGGGLPMRDSALVCFYEALRRLPTDLRYQLLELRFDGAEVYFEGLARSHGDATQIAGAMRRQNGFAVDAPRSEQLKDGSVAFTLVGRLQPVAPASGNTPGSPLGSSPGTPTVSAAP